MSAEEADPTGALAAREIVSTRVVGAAPASGEWTGAWCGRSISETCHSPLAGPGPSAGGKGSGRRLDRAVAAERAGEQQA